MDYLVIVIESLWTMNAPIVDGKKAWVRLAQWLTVPVAPMRAIKSKKQARQETTPNKPSKWHQLLAKHTLGWTEGEAVSMGRTSFGALKP